MADEKQKTVSFKLDTDFQEVVMKKLDDVKERQNINRKDWFTKAFALMEANELKEQSPDFAVGLTELETHTTRIYELVNEMVKQSTHLRENAVHTLQQQLEQQREIASDYQMRVKDANDERDNALEEVEASRSEQSQLMEQLTQLQETMETNKLLINEYKEKNDSLNGLIAKYEGYATENEELKKVLENERSSHQSQINELTKQNNEQTAKTASLKKQIDTLTEAHRTALERLNDKHELDKEKALLQAERSSQKALSDANNEYTNKVQSLYDKMDNQRQSYEQKIEELQRQLTAKQNNKSK